MDEDFADPTITNSPDTDEYAFIGGFVAGEGCFTRSGGRFRFAVALGATDAVMLDLMRRVLGVGTIRRYGRRKPHYDDEVVLTVMNRRSLVEVVVPFMDRWLPDSYKRQQYERWRRDLLG